MEAELRDLTRAGILCREFTAAESRPLWRSAMTLFSIETSVLPPHGNTNLISFLQPMVLIISTLLTKLHNCPTNFSLKTRTRLPETCTHSLSSHKFCQWSTLALSSQASHLHLVVCLTSRQRNWTTLTHSPSCLTSLPMTIRVRWSPSCSPPEQKWSRNWTSTLGFCRCLRCHHPRN